MKLSFKLKMLGLTILLSAVSVLIGTTSFRGLHGVVDSYEKVTDEVMPNLNLINGMYLEFRGVRIGLRSLGLPNLSPTDATKYIADVENAISQYEVLNAEYMKIPFQPGEDELYQKVNDNWKSFKALGLRTVDLYKKGGADNMAEISRIFLVDCVAEAARMDESIAKIKAFHVKNGEAFAKVAHADAKETNQIILMITIIGILTGVGVGFVFATKVSNSINAVARQLANNADHVAAASTQLASSSQELSQASTEQASSLEETAASLEEITAMIAKATENADATSKSAALSQSKAEEGRQAVDQMLHSMDDISQSNEAILNQVNESNRQMSEIVAVIHDIGNRTKVINEIVFQTKLLSFNASVEAARAGEHGKGFAVVAQEVGNLAQMSGNAAKEITDMLAVSLAKVEGIARETQQKVESMVQTGKAKVDSGVSVAKQCAEVLNEIVQNVSRVTELSHEIAQAAKEQAQGVSEINKAVAQLDTATQQNATTSEEAAQSSEALSNQADSLKRSVAELVAVISGAENAPQPQASARAVAKSGKTSRVDAKVLPFVAPRAAVAPVVVPATAGYRHVSGETFPNSNDEGFSEI